MDPITSLTTEFVRNLNKAIRTLRAYAPEHRQTQAALSDAFATLTRMLQTQPSILLGTRDGALILQGKPLRDAIPAAQGFCDMLADRNIATFTVEQGATLEEFIQLVKILSMSPEDLLEAHAVKPEHLKTLRRIRVNEMRFIAVQDGTPEGQVGGVFLQGAGGVESLTHLLNSLLSGAAPGTGGDAAAGPPGAAQLQALGAAMQPLMGVPQQGEAIRVASLNFDQIIEQSMANIPASRFVEEYLKGVGTLPEPLKRAILETTGTTERSEDPDAMIERLPLSMRGRLLAEDIRRGATEPAQLRQTLHRLAPSPAEFVRLLETVTRLLAESAETPAEADQRAADLQRLLPLADEMQHRRRAVLLVVRDRSSLASYAQALEEAGFAVTSCRHPDPHLGALAGARAFDAVVVDIGPYGLNQLEFMKGLGNIPSAPPLFLIEDVLKVRQPSEMDLCAQGEILYKPLEPQNLVQTLQERIPSAGKESPPSPPPKEEIESARRIQIELVPRELPTIPGYSLAVRYEPGAESGGNFHDVLALAGRRFGMFLMDVAGSQAAILKALITTRAKYQHLLLRAMTPAQGLAKINDLLAGEIPRGTFVRAVYAVLDPASGHLAVAAGGCPRPMRWSGEAPAIKVLQATGIPLGIVKGAGFESALRPVAVTLEPGDHVLFHTLGVAQTMNAKDEVLGERGIARAMRGASEGPAGLALVEVVEAALQHQGDGSGDDVTLMELYCEHGGEEEADASPSTRAAP